MPSILNSDDGVVSGTSGLKSTGGNDGITAFQQNGTERMRIDSSGNVGIGTTSPAGSVNYTALSINSGSTGSEVNLLQGGTTRGYAYANTTFMGVGTATSIPLGLVTGGTERVRIDTSGNVGIGETNPAGSASYTNLVLRNTTGGEITFKAGATGVGYMYANAGTFVIDSFGSRPLVFQTNSVERARFNAGAPILCLSGGNTSATGTGIAFPATQSASSDANTLDDYEEGTWTPVLGGDGGQSGQTYSARNGRYTKVGNICFVEFDVTLSNKGTITGTGNISGLPFTCANTGDLSQGGGSITYFDGLGVNVVSIVPGPQPNQTYLYPRYLTAAAANITPSTTGSTLYNNNTRISGMCWYQVA